VNGRFAQRAYVASGFTRSLRRGEGFLIGMKGSLHGMTRSPRTERCFLRARMCPFVSKGRELPSD
jgi:hypothetical protein